jgi:hypothetical protein
VIIDEAGMADTLTLDAAVQFAIDRGASVRLIGDDQQLAAIGAGGVLRDIKHTHGALHLAELHRFTDPAEAAASLTLRDGAPKSLRFYLDHGRVHVGDIAKTTEDAFRAWLSDRSAGLDAIMIAPTRHLVAELNRRARDHRPDHAPTSSEVGLADGNQASVGDVIITRANDRRLRLSATDWVKNGDRWTITHVTKLGDLRVRHTRSQLTVRLPIEYVRTSTGLGYATTIHSAQGVSADTVHGLLTGRESRQQLYAMLTRGRYANHLYLQVVGDCDPHTVIRPDTISPRTPTETLQQILARDEAPISASTVLRELNEPAARLFQAVLRYTDSLRVAAEQLVGSQTVAELDQADQYLPGLTDEPAWPTLRAHLLALAAETGEHPLRDLLTAASGRDIRTAADMAAVLDWRLTALTATNPGPLRADPVWGDYLAKGAQLVTDLAGKVQDHACQGDAEPIWAVPRDLPTALLREIAVWRPPTASIPKTRDQPEEPNSKRSPPCGNSASTGISLVPPTRLQIRRPMSGWQHIAHVDAGATTGSACTDNPNGVRAGRPRPADSTPQASDRGARNVGLHNWAGRVGGIRIPCSTWARNTFPSPAMRPWSSSVAAPHSVTSAGSAPPVPSPCVPPSRLPRGLRQPFCPRGRWTISA